MERVAVIDGARSPIGRYNGALKNLEADELGADILSKLLGKYDNIKTNG